MEKSKGTGRLMAVSNQLDLAGYFFVDDLPGSTIPASRLRAILERLNGGLPLTIHGFNYLQQIGLTALGQLARGEVSYESFKESAASERAIREQTAEAEKREMQASILAREAEQRARDEAYWARREAERLAREKDPKYIGRIKNQEIRSRYGIDWFVEQEHFSQLMSILRRLDDGKRLTDDDVLWLTTGGKEYFSEPLQLAFHAREAAFFAEEYRKTSDPWSAVNASSHYRKCRQAKDAHELLTSIPAQRQKAPKLMSAIATTHGGVMRDLQRFDDAIEFGNQAHKLTPKDFRPCTLLGAVNFELGNYDTGRDWYDKATELGASERSIDHDLRGILLRADPAKREEIRAFLLKDDPIRYRWVMNLHSNKPTSKEKAPNKPRSPQKHSAGR